MSDKQALLKAIEAMPDGATWGELTDALIKFMAQRSGAVLTAGERVEIGARLGSIPGVNPADLREAAAEADAGRLTPHEEVFARRCARK
jgi:hypothetical protein